MATSRYDTTTGTTAAANTAAGINQSGSSNTQQSGNTNSNTQTSSVTNQTGQSTTNTQNMTGTSLAALEALIQQLMGGGTQAQQVANAQRQQEITFNQGSRADYTKEAAFSDAQGLMAQTMRQTLEKLLPSINRASEGAGSSQSSMRALLTQQAAQQAAEAASAQGLNAAVQYGGANAAFSNVLERLTQPDQTVTNALLQALQVARGAVTNSTTNSSSQTTQDGTSATQGQSNSNSNTNTNNSTTTGGGGASTVTGNTSRIGKQPDELVYFGPTATTSGGTAGTSTDFLAQLNDSLNGGSSWSNGFSF